MEKKELVVVKFGSDSLVSDEILDQERINSHAERLAPLEDEFDLLVVTSGAVARGRGRVQAMGRNPEDYDTQTLAMLGSAGVSEAWEQAFEEVGLLAGQVLVTHKELRSVEGPRFQQAYERARRLFAIPILNHNDFLAHPGDDEDELKEIAHYADNDRLAKDVAIHLGARALILATGRQGFEVNGHVKRTITVAEIDGLKRHLYEGSANGTGGMGSKLDNAAEAAQAGTETYICGADSNFAAVLAGREICSRVVQYA